MRLNRRKNRGSRDRRKRPSERARRRDLRKPAKAIARAALSVVADAVGILREVFRWPARIWMGVAERLGAAILGVWRWAVVPALRLARRLLLTALRWGQRTVTPARGLTVVALAATIALGGSQFGNYRAVEVGTPQYAKVENVAPAPQVAQAMPRSAHGVWVFVIAVVSLFVIVFAVWRNYRLARLLLFGGVAVVAISLFVDRPEGLHLGVTGEQYSGAKAVLLGPFWVQLFAGATLAVVGPLLAAQLRGERAVGRRRSSRRPREERKASRAPRLRPGVET
jgi:hypothetical protein